MRSDLVLQRSALYCCQRIGHSTRLSGIGVLKSSPVTSRTNRFLQSSILPTWYESRARAESPKKEESSVVSKEKSLHIENQQKLVEKAVRSRLKADFPLEFGKDSSRATSDTFIPLSTFRTLLALNGFHKVVTPTGTKSRLYLAEGVVATPPRWNFRGNPSTTQHPDDPSNTVPKGKTSGILDEVNRMMASARPLPTNERLFAQTVSSDRYLHRGDGLDSPDSCFPEFVQEDLTLYRMAENSAARFLDWRYASWKNWTQKRFVLPFQNARYRTRLLLKSANKTHDRVHQLLEKSLLERCLEMVRNANGRTTREIPTSSIPEVKTSSKKKETVRNIEDKTKDEDSCKDTNASVSSPPIEVSPVDLESTEKDDALETLMVVSSRPRPRRKDPNNKSSKEKRSSETTSTNSDDDDDDDEVVVSATLYRRMTPSTRILALPDYYVLRHSSASTLVSVSLIVFGAIPLAYRSYVFSIHYDWLIDSSLIAASVIGTISYYIYAARWRARTSQSRAVAEALHARVYARDDASLWVLREGAVRTVTAALLSHSKEGPQVPPISLINLEEWAKDLELKDNDVFDANDN